MDQDIDTLVRATRPRPGLHIDDCNISRFISFSMELDCAGRCASCGDFLFIQLYGDMATHSLPFSLFYYTALECGCFSPRELQTRGLFLRSERSISVVGNQIISSPCLGFLTHPHCPACARGRVTRRTASTIRLIIKPWELPAYLWRGRGRVSHLSTVVPFVSKREKRKREWDSHGFRSPSGIFCRLDLGISLARFRPQGACDY